jgi:hypothetical protein
MFLFNKNFLKLNQLRLFLYSGLIIGFSVIAIPVLAADPPLGGDCFAEPSQPVVGETVTWNANVHGGRGLYYNYYSWSGSDNLEGSRFNASKVYNTPGVKTATIRVKSGNQQIFRSCSVNVSPGSAFINSGQTFFTNNAQAAQGQQGGLVVSCLASPDPAAVGDQVIWTAFASGGNGQYSYSWNGTNNLSGNIPSLAKSYSLAGFKMAEVTVTSGQTSAKASCSVEVNEGRVAGATISGGQVGSRSGGAGSALLYTMLMIELILLAAVIFALFWLFREVKDSRKLALAYQPVVARVPQEVPDRWGRKSLADIIQEEARKKDVIISVDALETLVDKSEQNLHKSLSNLSYIIEQKKGLPRPTVPGEERCHVIDKNEVESFFLKLGVESDSVL